MGLFRSILFNLFGMDDSDDFESNDVPDDSTYDDDISEDSCHDGNDSDYSSENSNNYEKLLNHHNTIFQGFDGFLDKHKTIHVKTMGGGSTEDLHIYSKPGSNYVWVSDGNCKPVCVNGHTWIKIGSHKFDVSKILNLV